MEITTKNNLAESAKTVDFARDFIKNTQAPTMVLVGGTMGSGKSTWVNEHLKDIIRIIDADELAIEMAAPSTDNDVIRSFSSKALAAKKKITKELLEAKESFVDMGTLANKEATLKKAKLAKELGFWVISVMIVTSPEESVRRNRKRIADGGRGVAPEQESRIFETYARCMETADALAQSKDVAIKILINS